MLSISVFKANVKKLQIHISGLPNFTLKADEVVRITCGKHGIIGWQSLIPVIGIRRE